MGVKPFLVASSIQAVLGQRLIRALCPKCKIVDKEPDPHWLRIAGITERDLRDKIIYKPRGCDYCTNTGFRGRIGIFEMMVMNNEIRTLAFERAPTNKVRAAAVAAGMKSLLMDGKLKVLEGKTTAEEIVKVAQIDATAL
jgi:type II secretory ATPase GspE/PulE/Tfp pilus assembly ATPase PilB-like protein